MSGKKRHRCVERCLVGGISLRSCFESLSANGNGRWSQARPGLSDLVQVLRDAERGAAEAVVLRHTLSDVRGHAGAAVAQGDIALHQALQGDLLTALEVELRGHPLVVNAFVLEG